MSNETKQWIGGYVDEEPNPVIWACGLKDNGKVCAERLRLYTGPRPPQWKHAVAYCPVHGVVPYFPNLEDAHSVEEAANARVNNLTTVASLPGGMKA